MLSFSWILLGLSCALITALIIVLSKQKIYNHESIEYTTSIRIWVFFITLPFIIYYILNSFTISFYDLLLIYIGSILNILASWLTFKSIKHVEIDRISPFFNLEVVFIFIFALLLFNEVPTPIGILGIFLVFFSILLIEYETKVKFRSLIKNPYLYKYLLIVILSTLYYALFKIIARYILHYKSVPFLTYFIFLNTFNAINSLLMILFVEKSSPLYFFKYLFVKDKSILVISFLTLLQILTEYGAYSIAPNSAYVSSLKMLYVIFSLVFAQYIYKERISLKIYLISILSFFGTLLIILNYL